MSENHPAQGNQGVPTPTGWVPGQANWRSIFAPEGAVDAEDLASFLAYYSSSDEPPDPQFLATVSPEALARLIQSVNEDDDQGKSLIALLGQVVWSRVRTPSLRSIRTAAFQHCGLLSTNIAIIQCDDGMNPLLT